MSQVLAASPPLAISAVTLHEASIVIAGKARRPGLRLFDEFVRNLAIEVCGVAVEDVSPPVMPISNMAEGITWRY
jgi:uncharacterized protein with PIN domain